MTESTISNEEIQKPLLSRRQTGRLEPSSFSCEPALSSRAASPKPVSLSGLVRETSPEEGDDPTPFRFTYFSQRQGQALFLGYHDQLTRAEVLLGRASLAAQAGLQAIRSDLDGLAEKRLRARPSFGRGNPLGAEHLRWFTVDGKSRPAPLSREALISELCSVTACSLLKAAEQAHASRALPQADQGWLEARALMPIGGRPLLGHEYRQLVSALEFIHSADDRLFPGDPVAADNAELARRAGAFLGQLFNTYQPTPFQIPSLVAAFQDAHRAHLELRLKEAHLRMATVSHARFPTPIGLSNATNLAMGRLEKARQAVVLAQHRPFPGKM